MNEHTYTNEEVERLKTDVYNKLAKSGKIFRKDSKITFPMITGGNKNKEDYIPEILNEEEYEFYKVFGDLKRFCGFLQLDTNDINELYCPYCLKEGIYNYKSYRYGVTKEFGATCGSRKCRGLASSDTKQKFTPEQWKEIEEKRSDFYEAKYGIRYRNALQIPEVRAKGQQTMKDKYGTSCTRIVHEMKENEERKD